MEWINKKINIKVNKPKRNAKTISPNGEKFNIIARVPPKAAPELTPIMCGSTSGL